LWRTRASAPRKPPLVRRSARCLMRGRRLASSASITATLTRHSMLGPQKLEIRNIGNIKTSLDSMEKQPTQ